ncbi:putative RNA-directed DNA polymerase [Helianthus annuus]|nr:putative RNA-directed DNA polymerase [Helianthus annuus]
MNVFSINIRGLGGAQKSGWISSLVREHGINFLAIQESKRSNVSQGMMSKFWRGSRFGFESVDASGLSGGLICMWDDSFFQMEETIKNRNFLLIKGRMVGCNSAVNFLNIYAPQGTAAKKEVWDTLSPIITSTDGLWVLGGDFNSVRSREEKRNCSFKNTCASNFNSFIFDAGLFEYDMRGAQFTWRSENGNKLSKLDRFLVNTDFLNSWPEARVQALPRLWSDHCPIMLISKSVNFGARPFRVFNSWLGKEGFAEVVEEACGSFSLSGCPPDVFLIKKLGFIRSRLRVWRDKMLHKDNEVASKAVEDLALMESILESRDLAEDEEWILAESKNVIEEIELAKVMDLKQRSRVKWAKEGDENSKFFHLMINSRKACNTIHGLNVGGEWVTKPSLVKKEVFNFFRAKFVEDCEDRPFMSCPSMKKISSSDAAWLESQFSVGEIKAAVFECGDDRAPGPDGFNFRFFKRFWNLFEGDFVALMSAFFESGVIGPGCGSSFITLVPKRKDPEGLSDYRPISLVGVVNKVISKVLASRLKKVLGSVISDSQTAFLKNRLILDGPLIINEVGSWIKSQKKKALLFKIDFEKAYDNINWRFVVDVLRQMGFGDRWCKWVWGVLSSARAAVLVNGTPTFEFKCGKGMRQGDPISPFLFVAVMEALSCLLVKAREVGIFSGIQLPNDGPLLSHLFFADDALIIGKWEENNAMNIVRILRCFHVCSGLKINLGKSNLFGIGVEAAEVKAMADIVGCMPESIPFKYLGLKVGANMNRVSNWRPVFEIFESRLALWKSSLLSFGGRITLVRSVLVSLPSYYFSLYKAPVKVIRDLESLIRKFIWGGSSENKKTHWVAWDIVSLPKKSGGLGICKLGIINRAFLSKWGWRFKREKDSLWVKVVEAIHNGGHSWSFLPAKRSLGGVWNRIVSSINSPLVNNSGFKECIKGSVGNGNSVLFWLDPWLLECPLSDKYPNLFALEVVKDCSVRDRVLGVWLWRHEPSLAEELLELNALEAAVASVSLKECPDEWIWLPDPVNSFSVKSVKEVLESVNVASSRYVLDWNKWVPLKCNLFVWKAILNKIPTADSLRRRNILTAVDLCPICKSEMETVEHLFTSCVTAVVLWQKISRWCRIPPVFAFSFKDLVEIHKGSSISIKEKPIIQGIIFVSCWCLWLARNRALFSGITVKVEDVFSEVRSLGFLWFKHRSKHRSISWSDWCKFVIT